jgi:shikimate dehydrogenase
MHSNLPFASRDNPNPDLRKKVFCILSDDRVFQTKSPDMFNSAIKHAGINGIYIPIKIKPDDLGKAIHGLKYLNFAGANIAVPYKEKVIPFLDMLSDEAEQIGAVNTLTIEDRTISGHNTNAAGFLRTIEEVRYHSENKSALIFGYGGAARAVLFALKHLKTKNFMITGRNPNKAKKLVSDLGGETIGFDELKARKLTADLVINATSAASHEESPEMAAIVENLTLKNCQWIIDLNYGRQNYFFRDLAQKSGTRFMNGIPMLAHQVSKSFALWTGIEIAPEIFLKGL